MSVTGDGEHRARRRRLPALAARQDDLSDGPAHRHTRHHRHDRHDDVTEDDELDPGAQRPDLNDGEVGQAPGRRAGGAGRVDRLRRRRPPRHLRRQSRRGEGEGAAAPQ